MRLCLIARVLAVASIALLVGYGYALEVHAPYWPHSWHTVAELGFLICALVAFVSAVLAAQYPDSGDFEVYGNTFVPR
ncbi:hypothetical protein DSECCO2_596270 [anaerobic digester metagenome]